MIFDKRIGRLDVTDCNFEDLDHFKKSIKGSIASKIGFKELVMTAEQITWYKGQADPSPGDYTIIEESSDAKIKREKKEKEKKERDDKIHGRSGM